MEPNLKPAFRPAPGRALALALGLLLLALALHWGMQPLFGLRAPFVFFYPAVGVAAMFLGWRPSLLVLFGGVVHALFWLEPGAISRTADVALIGAYLVSAGILLAMGAKLNQLRLRASDTQQALSKQVQDLQALRELGTLVSLVPDLKGQLKSIMGALCEWQGATKAVVWLHDAGSPVLRAEASLGFSAEAQRALASIPAGEGASGRAFVEKQTVIVEDTEQDPSFETSRAVARQEGFRAVHSRPLRNLSGEVFGVMSLHFDQPHRPTARDNQLGDLCCQMASVLAEREAVRQEALALSRKIEVALESSAVPFCLFEPMRNAAGTIIDFRWNYLNAAAAHALGHEVQEMVGHGVQEVLPGSWDDPELLSQFVRALDKGATVEFETHAVSYSARGWFHIIASPCEGGLAVWFSNISERKYQEQSLREADHRKDEFLATLAHELRNPLAPIRQAAMIARSPSAKPSQQRWSLEVIERQVANMALLLDDLLDVSRITRGKLELRKVVSNLREVVDSALEAVQPAIEARQQKLAVEWPPAPLWAKVDPLRMAQVVSNLLTNASKYTQAQGAIWLSAEREGDEAVVKVTDNGIGIPQEALEKVFDMFTQLRNPHSAASAGLGIGLALSRGLAQMHGATLTAESAGIGQGSTFTLRLALCEAPANAVVDEVDLHPANRRRRVLVADDNRDAAESLAEVLRMEGHEVLLAFDGEAAFHEYTRLTPEVALLDIGMPRMTGNEVASAIRSSPGGDRTLLVAVTGWGQERDRAAAKEAGFDYHFTKPVDPMKVLRLIDDPATAH